MQAKRYMYKYGVTAEQCARVAVKNRANARNNPYAQEPLDITVEDVLTSSMLSSPIRRLDAKPTSDGACAMILARESEAKKITKKPVWILGVSNCYETHYLGDRDLAECEALVKAAKKAYSMAGIKNPARQIDVAEISEEFTYQELMWMEGLGFCDRGEAGKFIDRGATGRAAPFPAASRSRRRSAPSSGANHPTGIESWPPPHRSLRGAPRALPESASAAGRAAPGP